MENEARLFKSLADETRLQIFWLLMATEELCVWTSWGSWASPNPRLLPPRRGLKWQTKDLVSVPGSGGLTNP